LRRQRIKAAVERELEKTFFFHIPKCAGTSVWASLYEIYGREDAFQVANGNDVTTLTEMPVEQRLRYSVIGGHGTLPFYQELLGDMRHYYKIVILRDPIDQLISFYNYICSWRGHEQHQAVSKQSFDEFAATTTLCNLQVRMLTGGSLEAGRAAKIVRTFFDDWAFTEELDRLVERLHVRLGKPPQKAKYERQSKRQFSKRQEIRESTLSTLQERSRCDLELISHLRAARAPSQSTGPLPT